MILKMNIPLHLFLCVCVWEGAHTTKSDWFCPGGSWSSHSICQTWWKVSFLTEPSHQPPPQLVVFEGNMSIGVGLKVVSVKSVKVGLIFFSLSFLLRRRPPRDPMMMTAFPEVCHQ